MKKHHLNQLQEELQTYQKKRKELLANSMGKFVLIKKNEIIGVFDTEIDAVNQGYQKFANTPFLVKQILEVEPNYNFLSNLINL